MKTSPEPLPSPSKLVSVGTVKILEESLCATDLQEIAYLREILDNMAFVTYLLFRGSRDGW